MRCDSPYTSDYKHACPGTASPQRIRQDSCSGRAAPRPPPTPEEREKATKKAADSGLRGAVDWTDVCANSLLLCE